MDWLVFIQLFDSIHICIASNLCCEFDERCDFLFNDLALWMDDTRIGIECHDNEMTRRLVKTSNHILLPMSSSLNILFSVQRVGTVDG